MGQGADVQALDEAEDILRDLSARLPDEEPIKRRILDWLRKWT